MTDEEIKVYVQAALDELKKRVVTLEEKIGALEKNVKNKGRRGWYAGQR